MATQAFDFQLVKLPPIEEALELFGGWMHELVFNVIPLDLAAPGDDLVIGGRVPPEEDWQVLQLSAADASAPAATVNGWKAQTLSLLMQEGTAPSANAAVPRPTGPMGQVYQQIEIWSRQWDGVSYLHWGEAQGAFRDWLAIRPSDPVISVHRWPGGAIWQVYSYGCEQASGGAETFQVRIIVLRLHKGPVGVEPSSRGAEGKALLRDIDAIARAAPLRD